MAKNFKFTLAAAALTAALGSSAAAESFNYLFNIRLGAVKIGEMRVKANNGGGQYTASGSLYTTGLTGALYDVRFDSNVAGTVASNGQYLPVSYTSKSREGGETERAEMHYSGDRVSSVSFSPSKTVPSDATSQRDSVDPMTLIYLLIRPVPMANICGGSYDLFDGKERLHVTYTNPRKFSDGRVACTVAYSGKAGGIVPAEVIFVPGDNGWMHIRQFSAKTNLGMLHATLR